MGASRRERSSISTSSSEKLALQDLYPRRGEETGLRQKDDGGVSMPETTMATTHLDLNMSTTIELDLNRKNIAPEPLPLPPAVGEERDCAKGRWGWG
jgi:hypothetical protein